MKPDQERVRGLLTDTVTLLCKNGLQYNKELRVQGLLGITLDNDDVFVVHIDEVFDELIGAQVTGIRAGEINNSAIAATDKTNSHSEQDGAKSRKNSVPQKHGNVRTSSPVLHGSSKRKASLKAMNPLIRVKKEEEDDDDIVIMDSSSISINNKPEQNSSSPFIPTAATVSLSGDGDREAMRISYVGSDGEEPPTKRRPPRPADGDGGSGGPFITGSMAGNIRDANNSHTDTLGNSSLDDSQLSNIGNLQDGKVDFDTSAPGCSAWDGSQDHSIVGSEEQGPGSQDSVDHQKNTSTADTESFLERYQIKEFHELANDEDLSLLTSGSDTGFAAVPSQLTAYTVDRTKDFSSWPEEALNRFAKTDIKYKALLLAGPLLFRSGLLRFIRGMTIDKVNNVFQELQAEGFGILMPYKDNIFIKFLPESFGVEPDDINCAMLNNTVPYLFYHMKFYSTHTFLKQIKTTEMLMERVRCTMGDSYVQAIRPFFPG